MKKLIFSIFILFFALTLTPALAQTASAPVEDTQIIEELLTNQDVDTAVDSMAATSDITAQDLGNVNLGWFSGIIRDIQIFITRDPLKKSRLELEKADVQMLKAKRLAEKFADDPKFQEKLEKANSKYEKNIKKINARLEKLKKDNPDSKAVNKFLDIFVDRQFKHQEILANMESKVPENVRQMIKEKREQHLERFGQVMDKVQTREEFKKRLRRNLIDENVDIEHRMKHIKFIEEMGDIDPELQDKIEELKDEGSDLWEELKNKHEEVLKNREEFAKKVRERAQEAKKDIDNPEARREFIKDMQEEAREMRKENKKIKEEARKKAQEFKKEHTDDIDGLSKGIKEQVRERDKERREKAKERIKKRVERELDVDSDGDGLEDGSIDD